MDFAKFFSRAASRRQGSMLRIWAAKFFATPGAISLANGMPNTETFPFKEISVTYADGSRNTLTGNDLALSLQYGPSQGYQPLVKKFREFQLRYHRLRYDAWDVMFTCGSQEACGKVFELLLNDGEPIMVQSPLYSGTIGAITPLNLEVVEIPQDEDGIVPEEIEKACERRLREKKPVPKLLFVNPTAANPTGTILPHARRERVYELAQRYDFLIVEDDPYYFVHFLEKPPVSFLSLDTEGRVLRLDSFSKIMSSGLRLGAITAHSALMEKLIMHSECTIIHPSSLSQVLVHKLLDSWTPEKMDEHFEGVRRFYRERRDEMEKALRRHLTGYAEWKVPQGGMFFWLRVPGLRDTLHLVADKCMEQGIFLLSGHPFSLDRQRSDAHLRLCYSFSTPEQMDKALGILAKLLREELERQRQ